MKKALLALLLMTALAACGKRPVPPSVLQTPTAPSSALSPTAQLGRLMFFDISLSASGKQACASCHDPAHAYAPANNLAVQLGGANLELAGSRAVPTLMYKEYTLAYSDRYENPDQVSPPGPGGGFDWDGRANSLAEQANIPLTAANEMANANPAAVLEKLQRAAYAEQFRATFGADIFERPNQAYAKAQEALQAFQLEDRSFHPYRSRFDRFRNNKVGGTLSDAERRGLLLFIAPKKGNCAACHLLGSGNGGSHDMTTDYSFAAVGVPRNPAIAANADVGYFDLGLCGPLRADHLPQQGRDPQHRCGLFKTPVLRNIASRKVFMHNGVFHSLRQVLQFYATRDTEPGRWYPKDKRGQVLKFNDLPLAYRASLDQQAPLDLRPVGSTPALSEQDIDDLLAFLQTLSDDTP